MRGSKVGGHPPGLAALLFVWAMSPARAVAFEVALSGELVRFDPVTGRALDPEGAGPLRALSLVAVRDEVVSFQVQLRGGPDLLEVATSSLTDALGHAADLRPDIFVERAVEVRANSDSPRVDSRGPGHYPDALVPTATVAVPAAPGLASLFVDLFVPRETPPGKYSGSISLRGRAGSAMIPLSLEVLDLALPERDVARLGAVSFGSFLEKEREDPALFLRWMQLAYAHALTVELMRTTPSPSPNGDLGLEPWLDRYAPFIEGTAFSRASGYRGPRAGQPITRFIAPVCEHWPVPSDDRRYLPSDGARWSAALHALEARIAARGWFAREHATEWLVFINSLDEPKKPEQLAALSAYAQLFDAAKLVDRRHFTFRVDGVLGVDVEGWPDDRKIEELGAVVDLWDFHGAPNNAPLDRLEGRRQLGERFMFYASVSGGEPAIPPLVLDAPIAGARAWAWIIARYGLDGALNWEVDYKEGCVIEPRCTESGGMNLDALLIYRGHEVGWRRGEPVASMRLKALRRGAQDVALLELLRARDPDAARRIAARIVPRALGEAPSSGRGQWPKDQVAFDEARREILDRLLGKAPVARERPVPLARVLVGALLVLLVLLAAGALRRRGQ